MRPFGTGLGFALPVIDGGALGDEPVMELVDPPAVEDVVVVIPLPLPLLEFELTELPPLKAETAFLAALLAVETAVDTADAGEEVVELLAVELLAPAAPANGS